MSAYEFRASDSRGHRKTEGSRPSGPGRGTLETQEPGAGRPGAGPNAAFVIDCAHYSEGMEPDEIGFYAPVCACGWRCPPCPDEETATDALMQHAYEAGILTERSRHAVA